MNHPPRLLDHHGATLAGRLLRAGRAEQPPANSLPRALAAAAAATTTAAVAGTASAATVGWATHAMLAKWLGAGVLFGTLCAAGVELGFRPSGGVHLDRVAVGQSAGSRASEITSTHPGVIEKVVVQPAAPASERLPEIAEAMGHTAPSAPKVEPVGAASSTLADEIALVDLARTAALRKDFRATLAAVAEYGTRYPGGRFGPEIMALKIEALSARGEQDQARRLARLFLNRYPASPLSARVRAASGIRDIR